MSKKVSPLKANPLRHAGQSVDEQIDKILNEKAFPFIVFPVLALAFAAYEWYRYYFDTKFHPVAFTIMAIISVIICIPKIFQLKNQLKNLKQGRDGEKAVGQYLELLREEGCIVFHDIVGDNFNIDHVVISEKGIYCIETKTYSKPDKDEPTVRFNEGNLDIDGIGRKNEILKQVQAASSWLKEIIKDSTGQDLPVKPVVLFPGWWIDANDFKDIWVLNPKAFPKFLDKQSQHISVDIKKMLGLHLSRYIRAI